MGARPHLGHTRSQRASPAHGRGNVIRMSVDENAPRSVGACRRWCMRLARRAKDEWLSPSPPRRPRGRVAFMSNEAIDGRLRQRQIASVVAAIERGEPVERALALVGIDRAVGATRVLRALESWGGWPTSANGVVHPWPTGRPATKDVNPARRPLGAAAAPLCGAASARGRVPEPRRGAPLCSRSSAARRARRHGPARRCGRSA